MLRRRSLYHFIRKFYPQLPDWHIGYLIDKPRALAHRSEIVIAATNKR